MIWRDNTIDTILSLILGLDGAQALGDDLLGRTRRWHFT